MSGKAKVKAKAAGAKSNAIKRSLVKIVVPEDKGKWISPEKLSTHRIDDEAVFPKVVFEVETSSMGPYKWKWKISWDAKVSGLSESGRRGSKVGSFSANGAAETTEPKWLCDLNGQIVGGTMTVEMTAGGEVFLRTIYIKGTNPSRAKLDAFIATLDEAKGYEKILHHEAKGKQFINADGEPVVAFDKGYGLAQLTKPVPTYQQAWNWKDNVKGGLKLYHGKRKEAKNYLERQGKNSYADDQLQLETFSRYNGGVYHKWDAKEKKWVRNPEILCDDSTGNIGWNTSEKENSEKTGDNLHKRDVSEYGKGKSGQTKDHPWIYTGVCYADHVAAE